MNDINAEVSNNKNATAFGEAGSRIMVENAAAVGETGIGIKDLHIVAGSESSSVMKYVYRVESNVADCMLMDVNVAKDIGDDHNRNRNCVAVDIETTGLDPKSSRIIEIGAVRLVPGGKAEVFQTFINPRCRIPEHIVEMTGIHDEMLCQAPGSKEALEAFLAFVKEDVLLGHNIIFDYSFLKRNAVNAGIKFDRMGIERQS